MAGSQNKLCLENDKNKEILNKSQKAQTVKLGISLVGHEERVQDIFSREQRTSHT